MITKFNNFINEESSPRIPNKLSYWVDKMSKKGKDVMIYTHDDCDGIFSAIAIKKYLISKGFNIIGYGIVNYMDGWDVMKIKTDVINVAVDFADYNEDIDIYIDHHGDFKEGQDIKKSKAIKTKTGSAYEGIMDQLGLPVDSLVLSVIDMIDSAKYDEYGVKWVDLLNFNLEEIIKKPNSKLLFAGTFNQLIKRSDYQTLIEVIHNATEPSVYQLFNLFKIFYPENNTDRYGRQKDFLSDASWRLNQMKNRTGGNAEYKDVIKSQKQFIDNFSKKVIDPKTGDEYDVIKLDGYVIIGELAFVGSGTWANAIRARAIIQRDINSGRLPKEAEKIKWVLLQYGDTLQMANVGKVDQYPIDDLPKTKEGKPINNLKDYCVSLMKKFKDNLGYSNPYSNVGGHPGIGTISNIGSRKYIHPDSKFELSGLKYIDIFKNYIIANLSKIPWKLDLSWENPLSREQSSEEPVPVDARVMMINQIRLVDPKKSIKNITLPLDYEKKDTMEQMKNKAAELKRLEAELEEIRKREGMEKAAAKHKMYMNKPVQDKPKEEIPVTESSKNKRIR